MPIRGDSMNPTLKIMLDRTQRQHNLRTNKK